MAVVHRHRTAITRDRLSIGARSAEEDGLLIGRSVLDYGCGRGDDTTDLRDAGYDVVGWDPHFCPDTPLERRDVVLLTYVLNTVDVAQERIDTLRSAWELAGRTLVLTTRLAWERNKVMGVEHGDGVLTRRGTFQHLYTTAELVHYASEVLGRRPVVCRPGVVYVFREDADRIAHLARRYGLIGPSAISDLSAGIEFYETRGRLPEACDGVAPADARSLGAAVRRQADPTRVMEGKRRTTIALLLFLSMERFHGAIAWSGLEPQVQADVRACFGSYRHATWRALRLLTQLRDDVVVRRTMRASVGKLTPSALYVHRRALPATPVLLRIYEECGALAAGRPAEWDVVKLHHDRRMVSWLRYPDFEADPHPTLWSSFHVDLSNLKTGYSDYSTATNPPVLHRKEEFLAQGDPRAGMYARLTSSELRAGLYTRPERIGTRQGWEAELARCGRTLRGHRLLRPSAGEGQP